MRSGRCRLLIVLAVAACARPALAPSPVHYDRTSLRRAVDSLLAAPETRHARWGVLIVDPERGDTLYSRDAGKLLVPASNMKILTSAVALDVLGPDFRYRTPFLARGAIKDGVLNGDLLVVGRGDPSVSDRLSGDAMLPLRAAAGSLRSRGIKRIAGRILPHGDAFPDANAGFGWAWEDFETSSGAVVDELLFNEGISELVVAAGMAPGDTARVRATPARSVPRLRVTALTTARSGRDSVARLDAVKDTLRGDVVVTGTIPVGDTAVLVVTHRDPTEAFLSAFREAILDSGIAVGDSVLPPVGPIDTLFVLESPPLTGILAAFLKPSQNQIGEMLLKSVALARTDTGTARVGRRIVSERLVAWGAPRDGFLVYDGSGLSRRNLVSPETIAHVLDAMRRGPHSMAYYDALPIAGVDGTLRGRMRSTVAEANARGKTGTLGNVRSLSGYVTTADGRQLIFSVIANNYLTPTDYITRVQDAITVRLAQLWESRAGGGH
jgi:D-alanyl-D-alanine carboxypeptidase/D-alanyl-D-alanine-endopeptidase (penicillin-binding protein 4)